jgi:CheY-like chemotaxis protein
MREEVFVRGRTTVVHIEADHANALLMRCLLGPIANYALHHAVDGTSGMELCRRVGPDLVITEMHLPDMTAYDVLRALRNDGATGDVPCVVFSADAIPGHIKQALVSGFDDYWTKPIDIWQLMQKIEDAATSSYRRTNQHYKVSKATLFGRQDSQRDICSFATLQNYWLPT